MEGWTHEQTINNLEAENAKLRAQVDKCRHCGDPLVCPKKYEETILQNDELRREVQAEDEAKQGAIEQRDTAYVKLDAATLQNSEIKAAIRAALSVTTNNGTKEWKALIKLSEVTSPEKRKHEGD